MIKYETLAFITGFATANAYVATDPRGRWI